MMEHHFTNFDYAVLGIMGLSCLFAFFRGLVREILSLVAWIGAGIVTIYYFPMVHAKMEAHFRSPAVAAGVAGLSLYIGALVVFGLINMLIMKTIKSSGETGMLDNFLGLCFGALRGALIVSLGYFLITIALKDKEYPDWIKEAQTRPYAEKGAAMLAQVAPKYLGEISSLQQKATDQLRPAQLEAPPGEIQNEMAPSSGDDVNKGYSEQNSRQLDRLIDTTNQGQPAQ